MKVLTNKHQNVAKIPVEMENRFCSHIDTVTSAQLIAQYGHNSQSLIAATCKSHFKKPGLANDAHFLARNVVESHAHSMSPLGRGRDSNLEGACRKHPGDEDGVFDCSVCKTKSKKVDTKRRFRTFIGGIRSKVRSK